MWNDIKGLMDYIIACQLANDDATLTNVIIQFCTTVPVPKQSACLNNYYTVAVMLIVMKLLLSHMKIGILPDMDKHKFA